MSYILAALGFMLLIVLHEAGHFAAAKWVGMRVERFSLFFGKPLVKTRRGETEYGIGWLPLGGYVKITGMNPNEELDPEVAPRAYYRQPVWKRLVVIGAGPAVNLLLAFAILAVLYGFTGVRRSDGTVERIEPRSAAVGVLHEGDRIVEVDGHRGDLTELAGQISRHRCRGRQVDGCVARTPAQVTVVRDGREQTLQVKPRYDAKEKRTRVGFSFGTKHIDLDAGQAADKSLDTMWSVTSATVGVIVRLFYSPEARDELGGVVGSYETTRKAIQFDPTFAVFVLGIISLSLAIVNLFPFLPLDGGHIFWALAEKVRGRAIPFWIMERASIVGFILVAVLFVIGLENDVNRLRNDEFNLR